MNTWLNLEGKTVIITGGASGIGKAVAEEVLNQGANVVVADMSPEAPKMESKGGSLHYVVTNVTDRDSVEHMVDEAVQKFGTVDILVNNAGINIPRLLVDDAKPHGEFELDDTVFDKVVNVNLKGVYLCAGGRPCNGGQKRRRDHQYVLRERTGRI